MSVASLNKPPPEPARTLMFPRRRRPPTWWPRIRAQPGRARRIGSGPASQSAAVRGDLRAWQFRPCRHLCQVSVRDAVGHGHGLGVTLGGIGIRSKAKAGGRAVPGDLPIGQESGSAAQRRGRTRRRRACGVGHVEDRRGQLAHTVVPLHADRDTSVAATRDICLAVGDPATRPRTGRTRRRCSMHGRLPDRLRAAWQADWSPRTDGCRGVQPVRTRARPWDWPHGAGSGARKTTPNSLKPVDCMPRPTVRRK